MIGEIGIYCAVFLLVVLHDLYVGYRARFWIWLAKKKYNRQRNLRKEKLRATKEERRLRLRAKRMKLKQQVE